MILYLRKIDIQHLLNPVFVNRRKFIICLDIFVPNLPVEDVRGFNLVSVDDQHRRIFSAVLDLLSPEQVHLLENEISKGGEGGCSSCGEFRSNIYLVVETRVS